MKLLENHLSRILTLLLIGLAFTMVSCDEDEEEKEVTVTLYEIMAADSDLSIMKSYIDDDATLKGLMEGTTAHTVFLPNNGAFTKLEEILGGSLNDVAPDVISSVLFFHFSTTIVEADKIPNATILSLQGENIVANADGSISTGGSNANVEVLSSASATNGETHVVETILIPPTIFASIGINLGKLSQPILLGADFTILASAIAKADEFATTSELTTITSILTGSDSYTAFAPSNATFEAASITADTFDAQTWYGIINNHIVSGIVGSGDLETCDTFSTLFTTDGQTFGELEVFNNTELVAANNGIGVYFDSNGNVDCTLADSGTSLTNLDAELAIQNAFEASNGLLHVIAGVLSPATE